MRALITCWFASLAVVAAGGAMAQTVVDGFTVTSLTPPTVPAVPVATDASLDTVDKQLQSDNVLYLTSSSSFGSSPYAGALASHAAFLSLQIDSHATFTFPEPEATLYMNWGSIGSADQVLFYFNQTELGTLSGTDLAAVFGSASTKYLSISAPALFNRVVLEETTQCCFEFSNLTAR